MEKSYFRMKALTNVHKQHFLNHNNYKGKGQAMMVSTSVDVRMQAEDEPDLDKVAKRVHNLFKFKNFTIRWTPTQSRVWP